jgi:hypothetical protein
LDLLHEARDEYDVYIKRPAEYQIKVDSISDMFHLRGKNRLKGDNCPVYFVGKFEEASIIMFGLNPGYSATNNPKEELEARKSWHHYQNLYLNFFQFIARIEFQSPYYTALGYLLSGLLKKQFSNDGKWRLFDKYLANIELIPYHSEGISLPSNFSSVQLAYLIERYKASLEFISRYSPKLLIFNGNIWRSLLVKNNLVQVDEKVPITQQLNMYFFKLHDIPCVLFDKFFQSHFWGISNNHRYTTIPMAIHTRYPGLSKNLLNQ